MHGGLGNAAQIQKYLGLEPYADQNGFLIAYINGTRVARGLSDQRKGWNAGECCELPETKNIDDVGFITKVVHKLVSDDGIDPDQIYGVGHSNGAMMTYRLLCETNLYRGAVVYAGVLELNTQSCPLAHGKPILAIHGALDENIPLGGGHTVKGVDQQTDYHSQEYTQKAFKNGDAVYTYILLPNAAHRPETINADLLKQEGVTLPQKIVSFLKLD